jgi:hypothetical protein
MSSLAATQADGYYIPPSYLESGAYKKKSLNQFNNSKGHNQYLTNSVCRFELPFDGFCVKCDSIIGKGTRFNAHKSHVDDYFTTKIYEFVTKCRSCANCEFRIRTNPKDGTFDYVSGIRRKVEEFDTVDAGTHGVIDTDYGNGILRYANGNLINADGEGKPGGGGEGDGPTSMLRHLERDVIGHRRSQTDHDRMSHILDVNVRMIDDAGANAALRKSYRADRKARKRRLERASDMGLGRGIELLDYDDYDDNDLDEVGRMMGSGGEGRRKRSREAIIGDGGSDPRRWAGKKGGGGGEDDRDAHASEKERFGIVRAGRIFDSVTRGGVGGSTAIAVAAALTGGPTTLADKHEKRVTRALQSGGARIVVGRMRKSSGTAPNDVVGDDGRNSRPSTGERGAAAADRDGSSDKPPHVDDDGGGALAALSSCYASDSD